MLARVKMLQKHHIIPKAVYKKYVKASRSAKPACLPTGKLRRAISLDFVIPSTMRNPYKNFLKEYLNPLVENSTKNDLYNVLNPNSLRFVV
jgi:hypothetical protein